MSRAVLRLLPVLVLSTLLGLAAFPTGAPAGAVEPAGAGSVEADLVNRINAARAAAGVAPLQVDAGLAAGARSWSAQLASAGTLSHDSTFSAGTAWAENVGYTTENDAAAALHSSFMTSPGHRDNILDPAYTAVGVGAVVADGTTWVTQRFGAIDVSTEPAPAEPTVEPVRSVEPVVEPAPEPDLVLFPTVPDDPAPAPEPTQPQVRAASVEESEPRRQAATQRPSRSSQPVRAASQPQPSSQHCAPVPAAEHANNVECAPASGNGNGNGPANAQANGTGNAEAGRANGNGKGHGNG